jgi:hypothetical protein
VNIVRVAAALILIAVLTGAMPAAAAAAAANGTTNNVTSLTEVALEGGSHAPTGDAARTEPRTTMQDIAIFGLISLGVLGLLWIRRHTSEL